jgi:hypothetical protein
LSKCAQPPPPSTVSIFCECAEHKNSEFYSFYINVQWWYVSKWNIMPCFHVFLSHIIIITFEQCAELTVAITITHRNITDTACRKCKFRCSLQLNCMKQIMKWLLETLIFIKISPQSLYGKYFIIKKFFFANITFVDSVNGNIEISGFHWLVAWGFFF